jgi:hypothetical protein
MLEKDIEKSVFEKGILGYLSWKNYDLKKITIELSIDVMELPIEEDRDVTSIRKDEERNETKSHFHFQSSRNSPGKCFAVHQSCGSVFSNQNNNWTIVNHSMS